MDTLTACNNALKERIARFSGTEAVKDAAKVGSEAVEGGAVLIGMTAGLAARIAAKLAKKIEEGYKKTS
jgi:hypothetical protein